MTTFRLQPSRTLVEQELGRPRTIIKPIATVRVQATATTIYTATPSFDFLIRHLWAANITGSAVALTVHMVPASGSPSDANACMKGVSIAANTTVLLDCLTGSGMGSLLQPGMSLVALAATADAINLGGWGNDIIGSDQ